MLHANIGPSDPTCYPSGTERLPVSREAPTSSLDVCTVCGRAWKQTRPSADGVPTTRLHITDEQWLTIAVTLALMGMILPAPISVAIVFLGLGVLIRSVAIRAKPE